MARRPSPGSATDPGPTSTRCRRRAALHDLSDNSDELLVHELIHAEPAQLAADPGAFDTAERELDAACANAIDEHHAGLDPIGDAGGLLWVDREHIGTEAVRR